MKYMLFLNTFAVLGVYLQCFLMPSDISKLEFSGEETNTLHLLVTNDSLEASMHRGKEVYELNCQACHGINGEGVSGVFPPLAKSDYMMEDMTRSIRQTIYGVEGPMVVNGVTYYGVMPSQAWLSDRQVADVLNYVRNSWGNQGAMVSLAEVTKERK